MALTTNESIAGCLLGGAVGDALGLPSEGLSRKRQRRLFRTIEDHRLFIGRGMVSDDTEHAILVAQALIVSGGDPDQFQTSLASQLRRWLLCLPAGVGLATLRSCLKLLTGVPPSRSGVFSAGNGPAMRAPLVGVFCHKRLADIPALVHASTQLTHCDLRAEFGALVVAIAAHSFAAGKIDVLQFRARLLGTPVEPEMNSTLTLVDYALASAEAGDETIKFAETLTPSDRVTGFINHTVPVCLHAAFRHPNNFRAAVLGVIACGGDTDTTAAIVGGIVGAHVGKAGIPEEWLAGLAEWPCSVAWMETLAAKLAVAAESREPAKPQFVPLPFVLLRNLLFLLIVLYHGFRRMLPPY